MRHSFSPPFSFLHPAGLGSPLNYPGAEKSAVSICRKAVQFFAVQRDAFFVPARLGDKDILDVFPKRFVSLKIDYGRFPAAFFVGNELDSGHGHVASAVPLWYLSRRC
jgi:hypothetical protein